MLVVAINIPVKQTLVEHLCAIVAKQQRAWQIAVAEQRGYRIAAPATQFVDKFEIINDVAFAWLYTLRGRRAVKHGETFTFIKIDIPFQCIRQVMILAISFIE